MASSQQLEAPRTPKQSHSSSGIRCAGSILGGIPELVELIVFDLPVQDILIVQRVSRTWHHVISSAGLLQQALFFAPITMQTVRFQQNKACKIDFDCVQEEKCDRTTDRRRPVPKSQVGYWRRVDTGMPYNGCLLLNPFLECPIRQSRFLNEAQRQTGTVQSWEKMLLTQPPVTTWHKLKAQDPATRITLADLLKHMRLFDADRLCAFMNECRSRSVFQSFGEPSQVSGSGMFVQLSVLADGKLW